MDFMNLELEYNNQSLCVDDAIKRDYKQNHTAVSQRHLLRFVAIIQHLYTYAFDSLRDVVTPESFGPLLKSLRR